MSTATLKEKLVNGIDVQLVADTISNVENDRDLGNSTFKITNKWNGGTRSTTTVGDMFAAKQTIAHKDGYQMQSDEPEMLSGTDLAPNPVEQLLSALASCVTTSIIAHASMKGIEINSLESEIQGDIDLNGFLGLDESIGKGYQSIQIKLTIDSPHPDHSQISDLARYSPVFNTLLDGTKIDVVRAA